MQKRLRNRIEVLQILKSLDVPLLPSLIVDREEAEPADFAEDLDYIEVRISPRLLCGRC